MKTLLEQTTDVGVQKKSVGP